MMMVSIGILLFSDILDSHISFNEYTLNVIHSKIQQFQKINLLTRAKLNLIHYKTMMVSIGILLFSDILDPHIFF